jgi:hypothetical protein
LAVGRETVGEKHKTMMGMHVTSLRKGKWWEIWWKFVAYLWKREQIFLKLSRVGLFRGWRQGGRHVWYLQMVVNHKVYRRPWWWRQHKRRKTLA